MTNPLENLFDNMAQSVLPMVKVAGNGLLPTRAYPGDAGLDLYSRLSVPVTIQPGDFQEIPTGLDVQPPAGYWLMVVGRSSAIRRGLLVNLVVVDSGYRGRLVVGVTNVSRKAVRVEPGERLAQVVPMQNLHVGVERVESLDPSERGSNGFGSSGK